MGRKTVVTADKYGRERVYHFGNDRGVAVPKDGYTPVVLKALWNEGIPVDWSPDDLTPSERAQLDTFCDDCGTAFRHDQIGRDEWDTYCPECDD